MSYKVGLVMDGIMQPLYVEKLIKDLIKDDFDICIIIPNAKKQIYSKSKARDKKGIFSTFLRLYFTRLIFPLENILLKRIDRHIDFQKKVNVLNITHNIIQITSDLNKDKIKINESEIDLMFCVGHSIDINYIQKIISCDLLRVRYGEQKNVCNLIPGLYEVYKKKDLSTYSIELYSDVKSRVLFEGAIATKYYILFNQAEIFELSYYYLKITIENLRNNKILNKYNDIIPLHSIEKPDYKFILISLSYLLVFAYRVVRKIIERINNVDLVWNVGYIKAAWNEIDDNHVVTIHNPLNHYLADPFYCSKNDADYCFVEDYDEILCKGNISVYRIDEHKPIFVGTVLEDSFHFSFPYIFEYNEELYMCPETRAINEIRLYKCIDFPLKWEYCQTIMNGVSAVDTIIFQKDNAWWMFTNINPRGCGDHGSEMYVYKSDSPLSNNWESHAANPVVTSASFARNAGYIYGQNTIYRPSQIQGYDSYGKGFNINEIEMLTINEFHEKPVKITYPKIPGRISGMHHISGNSKIVFFDYAIKKNKY